MDFREIMRILYKGFLYQLVVISALVAISFALLLSALFTSPAALAVAGFAVIALLIALLSIFFLYLFRGYRALHGLGFRWAWWLAWGPVALMALAAIFAAALAMYFLGHPGVAARARIDPTYIYQVMLKTPALLGIFAVFQAAYLLLVAARAITLNDLRRHSKVGLFGVALILLLIGYPLSLIPLMDYVGGLALLAEYIAEMLAYREAARAPPP